MNKELAIKIINYLKKLERNEIAPKVNSKKKNLLLASKNEYEKLDQEQKDYQELTQEVSKEEQDILRTEIKNFEEQKEKLIDKIKEQIIEQEGTKQNIVVEIRPGTGGTEAGLFARDLFAMYSNFAEKKKWKLEMTESKVDSEGNFTLVTFLVKGSEVFNYLKNEAGIHR